LAGVVTPDARNLPTSCSLPAKTRIGAPVLSRSTAKMERTRSPKLSPRKMQPAERLGRLPIPLWACSTLRSTTGWTLTIAIKARVVQPGSPGPVADQDRGEAVHVETGLHVRARRSDMTLHIAPEEPGYRLVE